MGRFLSKDIRFEIKFDTRAKSARYYVQRSRYKHFKNRDGNLKKDARLISLLFFTERNAELR